MQDIFYKTLISKLNNTTMKTLIKRLSNRVYPSKECPQCSQSFEPTDARQKFCCEQHRIDYHNDQRKIKEAPFKKVTGRIKKNEQILGKIFVRFDGMNSVVPVSKSLLDYEEYDFQINHERSINPATNSEIEWFFYYGLEVADRQKHTFIVRKRNFK